MSHAILPGAALGFMVAGLNLYAMARRADRRLCRRGLRRPVARLDGAQGGRALAAFFLISLALGVPLVSVNGTNSI